VLEMPWVPGSRTRHQPPDRYGNRWEFGEDLLDELQARFADVGTHELREGVYVGSFFVCVGR
jgi:hypothetical protein